MSGKNQEVIHNCRKFDDNNQFKYIIEEAVVSTTEGFNNNIPMDVGMSVTTKKTSARKSHHQFSKLFISNIKLLSTN